MFVFKHLLVGDGKEGTGTTINNCIIAEAPNKMQLLYVGKDRVLDFNPANGDIDLHTLWNKTPEHIFKVVIFIQKNTKLGTLTEFRITQYILCGCFGLKD